MSIRKQLPDGWRMVTFGDAAKQLKEDADPESGELERYVAGEHMNTDDLRIRSWGTIGDGYLGPAFHRRFRSGQILYGSRRTYLRKVAVADFDGICANTTFVLEAKRDVIEPDLLPFIMQSEGFSEHSVRNSKGSVNPYINWKDIASYQFPLPSLDEQRRIAEILWGVEESTNLWTEVLQRIVATKNAYLARVFDGNEVKEKNWMQMPLKKCAQIRTGIAKGKKYGTTKTVVVPYLSVANVQDGYVDLTEIKQITVAEDEVERYSLQVGDVLMTEGGDFNKLGRGTVWEGQINPCLHQNHVFAVRVDTTKILPAFLSLQASSPYGKAYFLKSSKQTTNLASVNATQVGRFPVLIPTIFDQEQIIQIIREIETEIHDTQNHLVRLSTLKKSLMQTSMMLEQLHV